jgi:tryptophan-rich sensory protein
MTTEPAEAKNQRSTKILVIGFVVSIVVCYGVAAIGGLATAGAVDSWYREVAKPSWNPPNWIFAPVWSFLYFTMAVSSWLVWKADRFTATRSALAWFGFHLILNAAWSLLFFGMKRFDLAMIEIVLLWISIIVSMILYYRFSKLAALLLVPYCLWVTFASCLNYAIWSLNRIG